jgi:hypothetical protein
MSSIISPVAISRPILPLWISQVLHALIRPSVPRDGAATHSEIDYIPLQVFCNLSGVELEKSQRVSSRTHWSRTNEQACPLCCWHGGSLYLSKVANSYVALWPARSRSRWKVMLSDWTATDAVWMSAVAPSIIIAAHQRANVESFLKPGCPIRLVLFNSRSSACVKKRLQDTAYKAMASSQNAPLILSLEMPSLRSLIACLPPAV